MTYDLIVRPEAIQDMIEARDWYENRLLDLGSRFIEAVDVALSRIADNPELYAVGRHGVRRSKLRRFPHVVYYRIVGTTIEILAVLHGRRYPRNWASRT